MIIRRFRNNVAVITLGGLLSVFLVNTGARAQVNKDILPSQNTQTSVQKTDNSTYAPVKPLGGDVKLDAGEGSPLVRRTDLLPPAAFNNASETPLPFGSQIFNQSNLVDRSIGVNADYKISAGDRIAIKVWGARSYEDIQSVDVQGNIFLPEVGSVKVGGVTNAALNNMLKGYIARVFTDNVKIYTNLLGTQPISVFVTGAVNYPGQYPGSKVDSVLYYLSRAGAIDPKKGSYRNIRVLRNGAEIARFDLYKFLLLGELPLVNFQNHDTVLVGSQETTITVDGDVQNPYVFEFDPGRNSASTLLQMAGPSNNASHAFINGVRNGNNYSHYTALEELDNVSLKGGDTITIVEDYSTKNILVKIKGQSGGTSALVLPTGTNLYQAAQLIEVNLKVAAINSLYIRRISVAKRQKEAIHRSLYELQRSVLTGSSESVTAADIRVQEAALVDEFISKVTAVEPEGRVVVANLDWRNMKLEDGDEIIIPEKSDVVLLSGEVKVPLTILWQPGRSYAEYIDAAGGISNRGDIDNILVLKRDGSVHDGSKEITRGDHIMVLPKDDTKYFAMFKDIIEIVYRVALSSAIVLNAVD